MLRQMVLKDRVFTMDALLTQRHVAQTIVDEGGVFMIVKDNQPQLQEVSSWSSPCRSRATVKRRRVRWTWAMDVSNNKTNDEYSPGGLQRLARLTQVFEWDVTSASKKRGRNGRKWSMGSPSAPERATPGRLLELVRGHWHIENKSHWVRDVTFMKTARRCAVAAFHK